MYGNLIEEYTTVVAIPVASRSANVVGNTIDCGDVNPKKRPVWVDVLSGPIAAGGVHRIKLQHADTAIPAAMADTGDMLDTITSASIQNGLVGQFSHKRVKRFIRLVHEITTPGAATLGAVVRFGIDAPRLDIEEVLRQAMFAVGTGAGMNIHADAIEGVCIHVRDVWDDHLKRPTDTGHPLGPGRPRWNLLKYFLLACAQETGRKAAERARADGSIAIQREHLRVSFNEVSGSNSGSVAGDYCPNWGL